MAELPLSVEERLAALEAVVRKLKGPPMDLLLQEGYFQIGSNNNSGAVRLDGKSIQVNSTGATGQAAISFVDGLRPDPSSADPALSQLLGTSNDTTGAARIEMSVADADPPNAPVTGADIYARVAGTDFATAASLVYVDSDLTGTGEWAEVILTRTFNQDAGSLQLYKALLRLCPFQGSSYDFTSDPGNAIEGDIWYNTTDNQFKFYEGSTIKTLGGGGMSVKVKEADETVTTSTTLQNDDELLFAVAANEVWQFEGMLSVATNGTADIKVQFNGPTGAVGSVNCFAPGSGTLLDSESGALGTSIALETASTDGPEFVQFWGAIHNGANAGNLQLQWAQNSSSGSTIVRAGSYIKYVLADN